MAKTKLLLTLLVMLCLFSTVKAQVSGIVFRDYNGNGTRQSGAGYTEPLAQGVVVTAYNAAEQTLATTTTNASGAYAFTALQIPSGTAIRLEFTLPSSGSCSVNSAFDFAAGTIPMIIYQRRPLAAVHFYLPTAITQVIPPVPAHQLPVVFFIK